VSRKDNILARLDIRAFFEGELGELKKKGARWFALCPFHADTDPSLSVDLDKGLWHCFGCEAGGDVFSFYMLKHGVDFKEALEALGERTGIRGQGSGVRQEKHYISLTLEQFSRDKQLPVEFLHKHEVRDFTDEYGTTKVRFPYFDGKKKLKAMRLRYGGRARDEVKFLWRKGDKALLYGLWRLAEFKKGGWLLLVEGESDTLTGWYHGLPLLGIPGKENYATMRHRGLQDFAEVYLWQEPDATQLGAKAAAIFPGIKIIQAPQAYKDLSEAHLAGQDLAALIERLKKGARPPPPPPPQVSGGFSWSDLGNARRLAAAHGRDLRYCFKNKKWYCWTGTHWAMDFSGEAERRAKLAVAGIYEEASQEKDPDRRKALAQFALRSENQQRLLGLLRLAQSEPGIPVLPQELDANAWLLNCANGTLDLSTGDLREHRREDLITCLAPVAYEPEAECEAWEKFIYQIHRHNVNVVLFMQQALGYALTGSTREQCLFIFWGSGANGKSTLLNMVREVMGDYARHTPTETLLAKTRGGEIPTDVARLDGPRLVTASEVDRGRRLAESLVKELTGRDTVSARFLYGEYFDFVPQFKLFLSTNNKPVIRGVDDAIWRRIMFVQFPVQIPEAERDRDLPDKLRLEAPGILAWMVRGCQDWLQYGLTVPEEVLGATEAYRAEMDVLAGFLKDCCVTGAEYEASAKELYEAYIEWAESGGVPEKQRLKHRSFGIMLGERGFQPARGGGGRRLWRGLGLRDDELS
jgi:putative DNA primase/helicase